MVSYRDFKAVDESLWRKFGFPVVDFKPPADDSSQWVGVLLFLLEVDYHDYS